MSIRGHGHSPLNILRTALGIPLTDEVTKFYPLEQLEPIEQGVLKCHPDFSTAFGRMTPEGEDQDEFEDVMIGQDNPWIMFSPITSTGGDTSDKKYFTLPPSREFYMEEELFDDEGEEEDFDTINDLFEKYGLVD